jgi:hypothetical protein
MLCDVERWPQWTLTMKSVRRMDAGPLSVGSRARIRQPKLLPAIWQVVEIDTRNFTWVMRSPGVQMIAGHAVEARHDGSEVTLTLRLSGLLAPLVSRLYGKLCQRYLAVEAQGLRKHCES